MIYMKMNRKNISTLHRFQSYYEYYHRPNLKLVSAEIGISNVYLSQWMNEKREMSSEYLRKINLFLDKYHNDKEEK